MTTFIAMATAATTVATIAELTTRGDFRNGRSTRTPTRRDRWDKD